MIPSLIVITLALTWLLYESDWLRIRLLIGAATPANKTIRLYRHKGRGPVGFSRNETAYLSRRTDVIFSPAITEPICGWEWLLNHNHPLVEYQIQITAWNCKNTIHLCDNPNVDYSRIMKDVCKLAFAKPKNGNKPRRKVKGHIFNANYQLLKS